MEAKVTIKTVAQTLTKFLLVLSLVLSPIFMAPQTTNAGLISFFSSLFGGSAEASVNNSTGEEISVPAYVEPAVNLDPTVLKNEVLLEVAGDSAVVAPAGPEGAIGNVDELDSNGQISVYVTHEGDTLSGIAKMFDVTVNTILWANTVVSSSKTLKAGQTLIILPISGVKYTIKKGDTIKTVAKKFKGDVDEITQYNGLKENQVLVVGEELIIPDGEVAPTVAKTVAVTIAGAAKNPTSRLKGYNVPDYPGYYIRPVGSACRISQGLHGWNAVDLQCSVGTPVGASSQGTVLIAKMGGWNGGYGNYVVLNHPNGTQTVYGHLSKVNVVPGQIVYQGQNIGNTGNSGNSTGPHVHFEIRGGKNNFYK